MNASVLTLKVKVTESNVLIIFFTFMLGFCFYLAPSSKKFELPN